MATTQTELKNIEKAVVKLVNKIKRADSDYTIQASINSTDKTVVRYAAQITTGANGLMPLTFISLTSSELIDKIKEATKNLDYDVVEKAYHEAQIVACKRTIQGHEDRIQEIENPTEVESKEVVENTEIEEESQEEEAKE